MNYVYSILRRNIYPFRYRFFKKELIYIYKYILSSYISMNLCLGFFGFIRTLITPSEFNRFLELLPNNSTLDIFISCPNKINELDSDTLVLNTDIFTEDMYDIFKNRNIYVNLYRYIPDIFREKSRNLKLPDFSNESRMFPYRIFSLHSSISKLSKFILNHIDTNTIIYDNIILTRFDIFNSIQSFGTILDTTNTNNVYLWRNHSDTIYAEDKILITSIHGLKKLANLYESINSETVDTLCSEICSEVIIGKYMKSFDDIILKYQEGICIGLSPFIHVKYEESFINQLRF